MIFGVWSSNSVFLWRGCSDDVVFSWGITLTDLLSTGNLLKALTKSIHSLQLTEYTVDMGVGAPTTWGVENPCVTFDSHKT